MADDIFLWKIYENKSCPSLIDDLHGLPPALVRKYATEVLRGLRHIHRCGLLHRDVKGV